MDVDDEEPTLEDVHKFMHAPTGPDVEPDTQQFLALVLGVRRALPDDPPDIKMARLLFRRDVSIDIARAPGRLDVMGGIADYSGSLVLQMPIKEACHVALQRRKASAAEPPGVHIVSLHADKEHRSSSYDAVWSALFPGGQPLSYAAARQFFAVDPMTHWAAYVAGCLLVLSHEKGVTMAEGEYFAFLVSSGVPEGKGVSSSAAIEVATMFALTSSFDMHLEAREVALLCQKVENLVVGAPCGIMDQMASACGSCRHVMSMLCQPAELKTAVLLPSTLSVWGVDSGVRHSVGGSDYASVRVATFMGRKILKHTGHLADIGVGEFMQHHEASLPLTITGQEFLDQYGSHDDPVTTINPEASYAVRVCTAHAVHEHFRVRTFRHMLLQLGITSDMSAAMLAEAASKPQQHEEQEVAAAQPAEGGGEDAAGAAVAAVAAAAAGAAGAAAPLVPPDGDAAPAVPAVPTVPPADGVPPAGGGQETDGEEAAAERALKRRRLQQRAVKQREYVDQMLLDLLRLMGDLMFQSHASYGLCGLGSPGTDRLVALVREEMQASRSAGEEPALFGAKITGGGSGGTVAILAAGGDAGEAAVSRVVARYCAETPSLAHAPYVFRGSSAGANEFGRMRLNCTEHCPWPTVAQAEAAAELQAEGMAPLEASVTAALEGGVAIGAVAGP